MESRNPGKQGRSVSESLTKREAIIPSEFLNLPDFALGKVHGFHMILGVGGVFRSVANYKFPQKMVADFEPRPAGDQELAPWSEADEEWLDGDGPEGDIPTNKIAPSGPDLGSLGRVKF